MAFLNNAGLERLWAHIISKLNTKVDKVEGKSLSTEDFTTKEKEKLAAMQGTAGQIVGFDADGNIIVKDDTSNVYVGTEEPTDPSVNVWIDPDGEADGEIPEPYVLPVASADTLGGVKIGKGFQMDGDVLNAVGGSEGEWELIETITIEEENVQAIRRSAHPDGTPYNLTALKLIASYYYPITVPIGNVVHYYSNSGNYELCFHGITVPVNMSEVHSNKSTCVFQAKPNAGVYEFYGACGGQGSNMEMSWPANGNYQLVTTDRKIDNIMFEFYKGIFPVGSKIEIYGVRA